MNIHLKFKKKHFYLFLIGLIVLVIGILAGAQTPNPGHSASEIDFSNGIQLLSGGQFGVNDSESNDLFVVSDIIGDSGKVDITGELYVNGFLVDPNPASTWTSSGDDIYYNTGDVGIGVSDPADITDTLTVDTVIRLIPQSSVPSCDSGHEGALYYDFTEGKLKVCIASNWEGILVGGVSVPDAHSLDAADGDPIDAVYVDNDGKVGIGTNSPGAKLDVEVTSGGAATIGHSNNIATGDYAVAMGYRTTASGAYSTASGASTLASDVASTAMGYLTTASGAPSTAMGSFSIASGDSSTAMGYRTTASGAYSTAIGREIEAGANYVVAIGLDDMDGVNCNKANSMCIMGGNVGIGTSSPLSKVSIDGNGSSVYQLYIQDVAGEAVKYGIVYRESDGSDDLFWVKHDGSGYLKGAWTYGSDRRLKQNIKYFEDGLDKITKLKPVTFDYIKGEKNQIGFIAQDVEKIIPDAVKVTDEETGLLGLKNDFIVPYLVNAVKELKAENKKIKDFLCSNHPEADFC